MTAAIQIEVIDRARRDLGGDRRRAVDLDPDAVAEQVDRADLAGPDVGSPGPTVAGPTAAGPTVAGPTVAGPTVITKNGIATKASATITPAVVNGRDSPVALLSGAPIMPLRP